MSAENRSLLTNFYASFRDRDAAGMARCYHPDAEFADPVFRSLKGREVLAMWHFLISRGKDTKITFGAIEADEKQGSCEWQAIYPYGPKKRQVHNRVLSRFEFKDGKIIRQVDSFDLWRWLGMALGPVGRLLGWSFLLKNKVRKLAAKGLKDFISSHPEYKS